MFFNIDVLKNLVNFTKKTRKCSVVVSHNVRLFLVLIRNLQNYTIPRLIEACYQCTSMEKLITETCWIWINLLLYLPFFTANKELKQLSRAIIRDKPMLCIQKRTIRKSLKPVLYYNSSSVTHRLILSGDIETNPGPANPNKPANQTKLTSYHRLPVN